jgi:hypothetical protein
MSGPFASIMGPTGPAGQQNQASKQPSDGANNANLGAQSHKSNSQTPRSAVILRHPAAPGPPPDAQYLDPSVDLENLPIPFARFPGIKRVLPDREAVSAGWSAFVEEVAPGDPPVIERKDQVPYYIAGTLKEAELINKKLREKRLAKGQSTIGKQRSSAHIEALGPGLFLGDDGDVLSRESALRALGAAAVIYSSHSYGFPKGNTPEPARGGRVVLVLNRSVTPAEYAWIWDAVNHLLGSGFDEHGRSAALCYGRHARRSNEAPFRRTIIDGAALDADALIELGRSLRPDHSRAIASPKTTGGRKRALIEEIERAKSMGAVRPPDDYGEWMSGAAAFKRAFPDDNEAAFQCYDAWSPRSSKYKDSQTTRQKFDEVPIEYEGTAAPVTLDMLHWRARRRAEKVIDTLYSPEKPAISLKLPARFQNRPINNSLGAGIPSPKGAEPIEPNSLKPEDGIVALDYLLFCWSPKVYEQIITGQAIPQVVLDEARRRSEERRERIDLGGRALHRWEGKNLAADTAALAEVIIASGAKLYRVDNALVRISAPISDPTTADRIRKMHRYKGHPGDVGDPARHAGERLVPILPSDAEALRDIIAEQVATKRRVNRGTKNNPIWRQEIASFPFKPSAKVHEEPDAGVLKDLGKRALVAHVPEIVGVITAPVMPNLPLSTNPDDLLQVAADRVIECPGFDSASGLYLSPVGTIVAVPDEPSTEQVKAATDLLRAPWVDFPFASPVESLDAEVGRSAAVYAAMIAANRRALDIAPGIGFSSHGEGMSSGKTLAGEIIGAIATGDIPAPVSLSTNFTEQRKEIITYFVEGDGSLFLDNIQTGTRFDAAPLASGMTSARFKGRLLGTNKQIEAGTRVMVIATGNSLNMAGDLSSRFLLVRLNTELERPEDRSVGTFKIPDLRRWVVEHRQQLVAAVHTIVRAYLQECCRCGGTPANVVARRQVNGTRFGGPCEVLRDAFLWAFQDLPDPFLSFQASALNSSTKAEAALVLRVLDRIMAQAARSKFARPWAAALSFVNVAKSPEQMRWEQKFRTRWDRMTPDQRQHLYQTTDFNKAMAQTWERIRGLVKIRDGRPEVRAGRAQLTSSEIIKELGGPSSQDYAIVEGAMHGKGLNPVALGRWLKERLVDAPINGLVLRSAKDRTNTERFWVERSKKDA